MRIVDTCFMRGQAAGAHHSAQKERDFSSSAFFALNVVDQADERAAAQSSGCLSITKPPDGEGALTAASTNILSTGAHNFARRVIALIFDKLLDLKTSGYTIPYLKMKKTNQLQGFIQ